MNVFGYFDAAMLDNDQTGDGQDFKPAATFSVGQMGQRGSVSNLLDTTSKRASEKITNIDITPLTHG